MRNCTVPDIVPCAQSGHLTGNFHDCDDARCSTADILWHNLYYGAGIPFLEQRAISYDAHLLVASHARQMTSVCLFS